MKKLTILIAMLMAIGGCSKEVSYEKLQDRDGVKYEVNSQTGFTGTAVSYYDNGQLESIRNYKDGYMHGLLEIYWKNGQLQLKRNYTLQGWTSQPSESYCENGELMEKTDWEDGEIISSFNPC
jgi:antitoxin component YwqK of YwqJK toxin-antitoxin module|tara:strand:- start:275 stop:643 length:369 start_codon:yes stop_codon:yes gene_type:complete